MFDTASASFGALEQIVHLRLHVILALMHVWSIQNRAFGDRIAVVASVNDVRFVKTLFMSNCRLRCDGSANAFSSKREEVALYSSRSGKASAQKILRTEPFTAHEICFGSPEGR